jgi:hypothetical protein
MDLGLEASGGDFHEDSGEIIEEERVLDYSCPSDDTMPIPKGRSIVHLCIKDGKAVYMLFDTKIAGKVAGIIQISAEIFWLKIAASAEIFWLKIAASGKVGKDHLEEVQCFPTIFNSYVCPWTDRWEQRCIDVHQIAPDDKRITSANNIETVWQQFNSWFYWEVDTSETVSLVTWNGESCDLRWLWKITQAPGSCCFLPPQIKYFINPYRVVSYFKTCLMKKTKSMINL